MPPKPKSPDPRIIIPIPQSLLKQIDEYRWQHRLASRAEAIRQLLKDSLRLKK